MYICVCVISVRIMLMRALVYTTRVRTHDTMQAMKVLVEVQAVDSTEDHSLTPLGYHLSQLPVRIRVRIHCTSRRTPRWAPS
jgi:HrpA-like RNA helicase